MQAKSSVYYTRAAIVTNFTLEFIYLPLNYHDRILLQAIKDLLDVVCMVTLVPVIFTFISST